MREDCHSEHEQILVPLQQELKGDVNVVRSPRVRPKQTACASIERDRCFRGQMDLPSSVKVCVVWLGQACSLKGNESHGELKNI